MEFINMQIMIFMKEVLWMGKKKVWGSKYLQMDLYMKDNGKRIKKYDMVKEFEFMEMENILVNLRIM